MSGIFGLWHLDGRPADRSVLSQCLAQLTPQGAAGSGYWADGSTALGCKSSDAAFDRSADPRPLTFGDHVCVFCGRLDNRGELSRAFRNHPVVSPDCPDAAFVLAAYDQYGSACVERIEGDFALSVFDTRTQQLLLARDRLGLRPLCYARSGPTFLFATDAKALLEFPGVQAEPDEATLADFLVGFLAADGVTRTFFRGIHSVPPAHVLIVSADRLSLGPYFAFDTARRLRLPAFRDYANALHEHFVAAVRKRLRSPNPVAVSVSGGLDSSYILCVAQRLAREESGLCPAVVGVNYGGPPGDPSDEIRFVRELERYSSTKIEHVAQRPGFFEHAPQEVWHTESPAIDGLAHTAHAVLCRVRSTGARRFLTGHWGDQVLSDSDYLLDLLLSGQWRLLRQHRHEWRTTASRLALRLARDVVDRSAPALLKSAIWRTRGRLGAIWKSTWFTPRFRRLLIERFAAERATRLRGSSHAWAMHRQTHLGYHLQCMQWNTRIGAMHDVEMAFPYLDHDLIQFLMSIPGEVQSYEGVSRGLLRAAMRGVVPDAVIERRSKGEFTSLANRGVESDFGAIREILGADALSVRFGYVDGPVLWNLLDRWRTEIRTAGDGLRTDRIIRLCGLELLLRRFFSTSENRATC
jgi:asparagine synthase (glutamine-hydrolysing)